MIEIALLFLLGKIIFSLYKSVSNNNAMLRGRIMNTSKDGLTYVDGRAKIRLMSNNHLAMYDTLPNGNQVLRDIKTNQIVKNFTQEQHKIEYQKCCEKAKKEGKTIVCTGFDFHKNDKIKGMRYRDLNTNKIYVIRDLTRWHIPFYVDLNGNIWKPVDENWQPYTLPGIEPIDMWEELRKWKAATEQVNISHNYYNEYYNDMSDIKYCGKDWSKR